MSVDEFIKDLDERLDKGIANLQNQLDTVVAEPWADDDYFRLTGKIQGLKAVKDWLRSYPTPEDVKETKVRWMVTWDEADGQLYQSGPYENRENAEQQFKYRHTDPLAFNIEFWEMTKLESTDGGK